MSKWKDPDWREFFKAALTCPLPASLSFISPSMDTVVIDRAEAMADKITKRMRATEQTEQEAKPTITTIRINGDNPIDIEQRAVAVRDVLLSRGIDSELIHAHGRIGVSFGDGTGDGMFVDGHHESYEIEALADEVVKIRDKLAFDKKWTSRVSL
jgi:hypothetical protein